MSNHEIHEENLPHEEIKYREHMKRATDLSKIELFLTARSEYLLALQYRPGDPEATEKAAECTRLIRRDRKRVLVIVPIVLAIIVTIILLV
jgi:hypothetical protein